MPRRNHAKGRRPQAGRRGKGGAVYTGAPIAWANGLPQRQKQAPKPDRSKLLPMVSSAGTCPTGKIRYGTEDDAAEALRRALINREVLQSPVVEERWYPQPGDAPCVCQGYHLTSTPRRTK